MSSVTTQLKNIVNHYSQYEDLPWRERIEVGRPKLFDFEYPFFDPDYKKIFETNFIKHFYTREIGFEVEELFKLKLDTWLNINMGYYNKLFESQLIEFNPLHNFESTVLSERKNDRTQNDNKAGSQKDSRNSDTTSNTSGTTNGRSNSDSSGETTNDDFNRKISSTTPQNRLELTSNDGEGVIEYADAIDENTVNNKSNSKATGTTTSSDKSDVESTSNAKDNYSSDSNSTLKSEINNIEDYVERKQGKAGSQSYSQLLNEYRSTFLRIERTIFNEMEELFMGVYG